MRFHPPYRLSPVFTPLLIALMIVVVLFFAGIALSILSNLHDEKYVTNNSRIDMMSPV